jgi:enamine deaminase RidA (YjgF/YER057c/UK114 family)
MTSKTTNKFSPAVRARAVRRFNAVYDRHFPGDSPARIFLHVPSWPGPFDVEVDCVAMAGQA